jgi:hypothetical protein
MMLFRLLLLTIIATVGVYTAIVVAEHGLDLLPIFFGDIAKMEWPGQFNVDFFSFMTLGAVYIMWRHQFAPLGLALGFLVFVGGAPYVCIYLLVASFQANGDVKETLLGKRRAAS